MNNAIFRYRQYAYGYCNIIIAINILHLEPCNSLVLKRKNAGMSCSYEAKNLSNPTRQRPGDIFVPEFDNYGDAYLDVSVNNQYYLQKSFGKSI
jgi:hypothetical protein